MKIPEGTLLFRGLGGTRDLPECFHKPDEHGCRGIAEWGFMSTTASRSVALKYSGVEEGKPQAMVLEIRAGAVDRGANIEDFSQYPEEREYLWVPCSFVEPSGEHYLEVSACGVVQIIPVRVNANLKTSTLEELEGKKKAMHLAAFDFLLDEVKQDLERSSEELRVEERLAKDITRTINPEGKVYTLDGLLGSILEECKAAKQRHEELDASEYVKEERFRGLVTEMLEVKVMALCKLRLCWYVQDKSIDIRNLLEAYPLRISHRCRISFMSRELAKAQGRAQPLAELALELCKLKGVVDESVSEVNELGEPRIVRASADGFNPRDLELLLAAGAHVNSQTLSGFTALISAAMYGHADTIRFLVRAKADLGMRTRNGCSAIYVAAGGGSADCLDVLISSGADVSDCNIDGFNPLMIAAQRNHKECVELLVRARADVNRANVHGATALSLTAQAGHAECIRLLAHWRADVNVQTPWGTLSDIATVNGQAECVEALRALGAVGQSQQPMMTTPITAGGAMWAGGGQAQGTRGAGPSGYGAWQQPAALCSLPAAYSQQQQLVGSYALQPPRPPAQQHPQQPLVYTLPAQQPGAAYGSQGGVYMPQQQGVPYPTQPADYAPPHQPALPYAAQGRQWPGGAGL